MRTRSWLMVAILGFTLAGCDATQGIITGDSSDDAPEYMIDLADPYGGLDSADEEPAFADPYMANVLTDDEPVLLDEEPVDEERASVFFLRAVWGYVADLPTDTDGAACGELVWNGGLSTSDGVIRPVSTIRFERRGDYADSLVLPRDDRSVLEWASTTGCGRDGVVIALIVPAAGDSLGNGDGLTEDDTVTFDTGPLTIAFKISELDQLDSLVMVDDENGVKFTGFAKGDLNAVCRRGLLAGAWHQAQRDSVDGGFFRAAWLNPVGEVFGYVRGRYGVHEGTPVFRGKLINRHGGYEGHVSGTWEPHNRRGGSFRGKWLVVHPDRDPVHLGVMKGRWHAGRGGEGGWMHGRWNMRCHRDGEGDGDGNREGNGSGNGNRNRGGTD